MRDLEKLPNSILGAKGTIRRHIIGLVSIVVILSTVLVMVAGSLKELDLHHDNARQRMTGIGNFLARISKPLLSPDKTTTLARSTITLESILESVQRNPAISRVVLIDRVRHMTFDGDPKTGGEIRFQPLPAGFDRYWSNIEPRINLLGGKAEASYPILTNGKLTGAIYLTATGRSASSLVTSTIIRNTAIAAFMIIVAVALTIYQLDRLVQPIQALTRSADRMARGDLDAPVDVNAPGELGILAKAFKRMVATVGENLAQINKLAFHDSVTGLPNRQLFLIECEKFLDTKIDGSQQGALLFIDLDQFKRINDVYGHDKGDMLLKGVSERMSMLINDCYQAGSLLTADDEGDIELSVVKLPVLARLGGDEFGILLPQIRWQEEPEAICEMLLEILRAPLDIGGHTVVVGASIGIARYPEDGDNYKGLLKSADLAMYQAKREGRNRYAAFHSGMNKELTERMEVEENLRVALDRGEFEVYFQPKVACSNGRAIGAEALLRWNHPKFGQIPPDKFVTIAEELGLIYEIGEQTLLSACKEGAGWLERGHELSVSVNISLQQLERADFSERVLEILRQTGLPGHLLELEVTESVAMSDPDQVLRQVAPLKGQGVRFSIDDFGTGYSNLAVLKRLPFDILKVDRSFIADVPNDNDAANIVEAILALASSLNFKVVAEGVERQDQLAFLIQIGCHYAQGYWFGRPMPSDEFAGWIDENQTPDIFDITEAAQQFANSHGISAAG